MVKDDVWLDCDPGHDDAIALLLALFASSPAASSSPSPAQSSPSLNLLGMSTVHGNAPGSSTFLNAVRLLAAYKIEPTECKVWRGADVPLTRSAKADVGIHGEGGLGGVECLPDLSDELVQRHLLFQSKSGTKGVSPPSSTLPQADPLELVAHLIKELQSRLKNNLPPISIVATGPLTNIALLIKLCPGDSNVELLQKTVDRIVIMGGSAGAPGNRSPLAEWNILVDPEAASIVFDSPIPVVMAGLNVTHQAIFTPQLHRKLLLAGQADLSQPLETLHRQSSPLRRLLSSAITFFSSTYESEFGFELGPPVHDMVAVAYVLDPSLFYSKGRGGARLPAQRFRVKVDTSHSLTAGTTIVDFHNQWPAPTTDQCSWQAGNLNAIVLEYVDTDRLWALLFEAVDRAEALALPL